MTKKKEKLAIIDGNALIHRSFHALPPTMTTKDGSPVNAVFGFTSVLLRSIKDLKPDYIVVTFDKKGPTFRHKKYKEYKATRTKAPDELYMQIPAVKEIVKAFNIPIFEQDGFEADDLIGTITKLVPEDIEKVVVTGDMDTLQLVNSHTHVYTMSRGMSDSVIYDTKKVKEKYSFSPDQVIDYKALRGDPSDNIPGVKGVGEKTATDLLINFKDLDGVYKNINSDKIKDRIRNLLLEHKKEAYISQDLATIKCDVPLDFDIKKAQIHDFDKEKIISTLSKYEFRSLLTRAHELFGKADERLDVSEKINKFERNKKDFKYVLIDDDKAFEKFFTKLKKQKHFSFDTETTGFDFFTCSLLGISFSWNEGEAYYLNFKNKLEEKVPTQEQGNLFDFADDTKKLQTHPWLTRLAPIFKDEKIKKNAHNAKFDIKVLAANNIELKGLEFDTMIAGYLLNPGARQNSLDAMTFTEFAFEKINKDDLLGTGKNKLVFSQVETERMYIYSCEDADFTERLYQKLKPRLKEEGLDKIFEEIEVPLILVLAKMENEGIELDTGFLKDLQKKVQTNINKHEKKIFELANKEFNIKSTQQLSQVLFEDLGISTAGIKKNKTGFSTAFDELEKIKDKHKVIKFIQEYRELTKLQSTYIEALPKLVNKKTKRIHTSFNQTIAATGRLSSTDPNLQNIPIRTELGRLVRKAFVAKRGYSLVSLDYSQIELRLAAHMSGDKKMIAAFKNGEDIHASTAANINDIPIDEVDKNKRREAKAINFGILYGQGPHGLSQTADISYFEARQFIDQYFTVYSGVKKYLDSNIDFAREHGYIKTMFGRVRNLPDINSSVVMVKKAAERVAINTPLQGTAADIIKMAMIKVSEEDFGENAKMLLQVHDELVFEIKKNKEKECIAKIKKIMENIVALDVEMKVDVKIGKNWNEMEDFS
ncbi:DNA polymerase I [Candidatus Parcubacteria bacterium]|nr:MAG: DNA polymerase I [Candidatus Parcubacteria bacterium]